MKLKTPAVCAWILFAVLSALDVLFLASGNREVPMYIKPLLMPSLALSAWLSIGKRQSKTIVGLILVALLFHTAGDVFLMFSSDLFFAAGLIAFLVGHIIYFRIFCLLEGHLYHRGKTITGGGLLLNAAVVLTVSLAASIYLNVNDALLQIGVFVYAFAMAINTYMAGRGALKRVSGFGTVFLGYLLFVASDSILALGVFNKVYLPFHSAAIMLTYTLAEGLIVWGLCSERKELPA